MNNTQITNQIVKTFNAIKADKNGNVSLQGRLSFNKSGGLSTRMLSFAVAVGFVREYRRNLLHNGSSVSFESLCKTLSASANIDQMLTYRFTKTGEKNGESVYTKVTYNKAERADRIRSLSTRIKKHYAPAFAWNTGRLVRCKSISI
jgi:hypothetical protein